MEENCDEKGINLRALKQMDASIDQIVLTCGQCAVYKFSSASNEWERKEIEGSMFVVHRQRPANYGFVVINRLNTTNMFQTIDHNFDINITIPYLLYKNSLNEIFCIWFYNENDCRSFNAQLKHIIDRLAQERSHGGSQPNADPNDILKKLLTMDLNSEDRSAQRAQANAQNPQQPTATQSHPQKLSLQVHQLFQSHMGSQPIPKPLRTPDSTAQHFEDALNDVITPAMLTTQSTKPNPNDSLTQRQSPVVLSQSILEQNSIQFGVTTAFNQNYLSVLTNNDKYGSVPSVPTLTMEQLKQTLIHLLQSDADFLHSIHSAYIQSIKK